MPSVLSPTSSAVPCLSGLYVALGADEPAVTARTPVSPWRRGVAVLAAGILALGLTAWPAPVAALGEPAAERPAATLPEHAELAPEADDLG